MEGTAELFLWQQSWGGALRTALSPNASFEAVRCRQISSRCFQGNTTNHADTAGPGSFRAFVDANEKDGLVLLLYSIITTNSIVNDL